MKKVTIVTVVAALAFATQALAVGGTMNGSRQMTSTMPRTTMQSGAMTTAGTGMTQTPKSGAGTMSATMSGTGKLGMATSPAKTPMPASTTMKTK